MSMKANTVYNIGGMSLRVRHAAAILNVAHIAFLTAHFCYESKSQHVHPIFGVFVFFVFCVFVFGVFGVYI